MLAASVVGLVVSVPLFLLGIMDDKMLLLLNLILSFLALIWTAIDGILIETQDE